MPTSTQKTTDLIKWHRKQVNAYAKEKPIYKQYKNVLEKVLTEECQNHAYLHIVTAREKSIESFAEKALRKREKYDNPVKQLTDLCGARVILHTREEVDTICRFIRKNFRIDEVNTVDKIAELRKDQFGYRGVHLIVQIKNPRINGIDMKVGTIKDRKAEIQVRTISEHAWADIVHDRLYKGSFEPPKAFERLSAELAAMLENVDDSFGRLDGKIQEYLGDYMTYMDGETLKKEIDIQKAVLKFEKKLENSPNVRLKLAGLYRADTNLKAVIDVLKPVSRHKGILSTPILFGLGSALVDKNRRNMDSDDFIQGQKYLAKAAGLLETNNRPDRSLSLKEKKLRAAAAAKLAESNTWLDEVKLAVAQYNEALLLDPDDPYHLVSLLQFRLKRGSDRAMLDAVRPAMLDALEVCRRHVDAGLQLPRAWLTMGRLNLLLRRRYDALECYAKAIWFYRERRKEWPQEEFDNEMSFVQDIYKKARVNIQQYLPEKDWVEMLLTVGRCVVTKKQRKAATQTKREKLHTYHPRSRILIIAGAARNKDVAALKGVSELIQAAIGGFTGTIVAGGTMVGIPGIVGKEAAKLPEKQLKKFELIAYHGKFFPVNGPQDENNYDEHFQTDEDHFSAEQPLRTWIDILSSGVHPKNVRVLGINGGPITRFELALATALGAQVGAVESSGRASTAICSDVDWSQVRTLLPLPNDPATVQALVHYGASQFTKHELERMGRIVHETYLKIALAGGKKTDYRKPNTLPWDVLPEEYKESSRAQAAYAVWMLSHCGYHPKRVSKKVQRIGKIRPYDIERLAQMEHGRWNFERLSSGWRYAPNRDDEKKLHSALVPWTEVPEDLRKYDRKAVMTLPTVLASCRLRVTIPRVR